MSNTKNRGFASMNNEKQREIASKGGRAAHVKGTAHEWSSEEARAAGRKGGESRGQRNNTLSVAPLSMSSTIAQLAVADTQGSARDLSATGASAMAGDFSR